MTPDHTVTRSTTGITGQSEDTGIVDPITLLRTNLRAALDRQAAFATEARALAARVNEVTTELATLARVVPAYRALLAAVDAARATTKTDD
jgi:hypothetical protein